MVKGLMGVFLVALASLATAGVDTHYANPLAPAGPELSAQSALIMDELTGRVLFEKDPDTQRFPASTTKIMTALLLIEHCSMDDMITAPPDIETVNEASLHLKPGEQISVRDMLYAIMLRSGNDACYAIACHIAGSQEKFAEMMNERAKLIGCKNTHFANPHGLHDPQHYTCARDLALIAREAMRHPEFREVVATQRHEITRSINREDRFLVSHNRYLQKDPTADGIKTGFTRPAGRCYVGSATRNGYRLITVVLKSDDWQSDHAKMLDWAFAIYSRRPIAGAKQPIGWVAVEGGENERVAAVLHRDVDIIARSTEAVQASGVIRAAKLKAPVAEGQQIGEAVFTDSTGVEQVVPVFAAATVPEWSPGLIAGVVGQWRWMVLLGGSFWVYSLTRRGRRRKTRYAGYAKS
jgi:D-alanyl-D-alanine carboxypeptidase (penicillin-binding protein 5/6)